MTHPGTNRVRVLTRWIVVSCLTVTLAACGPPRGPAYDPAALPPPDPAAQPDYVQGEIPPPPAAAAAPPASTKPRLFGFLFKRVPGEVDASDVAAAPPGPDETGAGPEVTTARFETQATEAPERRGLFAAPGTDAGPRADLPFGEVATVCKFSGRDLGKEVASSSSRPKFTLYDTQPDSIEPRTQFITGFKDGCARQFTASLALFGTAQVHETTRYNPLNTNPYSATDEAYEKVKNRICRVGRGAFCPDRPAKRLNRDAAFLSVYRTFGGSGTWMELFLHKGRLVSHSTMGG